MVQVNCEGEAVILEVSYSLVYDEKKKDEEREKLLLELEELKEKQQEHNTTLSRVQVFYEIFALTRNRKRRNCFLNTETLLHQVTMQKKVKETPSRN